MALFGVDALRRRLGTNTTSAGSTGIMSRGANVYNGGSSSAPGAGRPSADRSQPANNFGRSSASSPGWGSPGGMLSRWNPNVSGSEANRRVTSARSATPLYHATPEAQGGSRGGGGGGSHTNVFNPIYAEAIRRAMERQTAAQSEYDQSGQRLTEDFSLAKENTGRWRNDTLKDWRYSTADQGLVHSGINIAQQGEIGEDYLRTMQEVNQGYTRGQEDLERNFANYMQQLESERRMAEAQNALYQSQIAMQDAQTQAAADMARESQAAAQPQPTSTGRIPINSGGSSGGNQPNNPTIAAIANKLGYHVGSSMDDADYLKAKDRLGIKVGQVLDPEDKAKIDAALRRLAG